MLPVGFNFGKKNQCPLCQASNDTDKHLISCPIIKSSNSELIENTELVFEDVYNTDSSKVSKIAKLLSSALRTREELIIYFFWPTPENQVHLTC